MIFRARAMLTGMMHKYIVPAVSGFFRSITLSDGPARGNSLQDTLRLLTLWFDYGHLPDVYEALVEGINKIQIDNWLQVHWFILGTCCDSFQISMKFGCIVLFWLAGYSSAHRSNRHATTAGEKIDSPIVHGHR